VEQHSPRWKRGESTWDTLREGGRVREIEQVFLKRNNDSAGGGDRPQNPQKESLNPGLVMNTRRSRERTFKNWKMSMELAGRSKEKWVRPVNARTKTGRRIRD